MPAGRGLVTLRSGRCRGPLGWLLLLLLAGACHEDRQAPVPAADPPGRASSRPHLVIISIDTLRADHLGCYGYERDTSPALDAFARRGVLFTRSLSPTAWTLQGHASLFSGLSPRRTLSRQGPLKLRKTIPLLSELLQQQGEFTGASVNGEFLKSRFGFDRGFDVHTFVKHDRGTWPQLDERHEALLQRAQREARERPVFLFFHFMSAHIPYDPPPQEQRLFLRPYDGPLTIEGNRAEMREIFEGSRDIDAADRSFLVDLYDGAIHATDARVGRLLERIDELLGLDRTLVVITSDHGEEFLEHGSVLHTRTLYEEILRVPLLIVGPGVPAERRLPAVAALPDVLPTVLELLGLPRPADLDGRSLVPCWTSGERFAGRVLELATYHARTGTSKWGLRSEQTKFVVDLISGEKAAFDLRADPAELHDVYPSAEALALEARLQALARPEYGKELELSEEERLALRQLGYIK